MAQSNDRCRACRRKVSSGSLYPDGYCSMCHNWVPIPPKEKVRRIRETIKTYPEKHPERVKYEKIADEIEKSIDDVPT